MATWGTIPGRASPSRTTAAPAKPCSTATSSPTRRARTSSRARAPPSRSPRSSVASSPRCTASSSASQRSSSAISGTCRTSSSPSSTASCICFRRAARSVPPQDLDQLFHPMVDPRASVTLVAKGLPASPGAATGEAVFDADEAEALAHEGRKVILIRPETSPEDFHGIVAAQAVLTARGGMTSHAAVVARGMGKTCVVGAKDIEVDPAAGRLRANGRVVKWGQLITVDGTTGRVLLGAVKLVEPKLGSHYAKLMAWADEHRRLRVRANADTPGDAKRAREFGAEGIGLCRTEHMFFEGDRITAMREMIVAPDEAGRRHALARLLPMQRADFEGIFEAMAGHSVTIRLLDPPLHEFLPKTRAEVTTLARAMRLPVARLERLVESLVEANPMLGHRGCRLGITYPEITEMQARAIFEAACRVVAR